MIGNDELTLYPHFSKILVNIIGGLYFTLLGFYVSIAAHNMFHNRYIIPGYITMLLFGAGTMYWLSRLLIHRPLLLITSQYIQVNASGFHTHSILWTEISSLAVSKINKDYYLEITTRNPESIPPTLTWKLYKLFFPHVKDNIWMMSLNMLYANFTDKKMESLQRSIATRFEGQIRLYDIAVAVPDENLASPVDVHLN
jgi:hypothetical protein